MFGASPIRQLTPILRLPPVRIYHGTKDATVPVASSVEFGKALSSRGVDCRVTLLEGMTHSEPLLEGPLRGDHVFADLITSELGLKVCTESEEVRYPRWQILLIKLAQFFMPF